MSAARIREIAPTRPPGDLDTGRLAAWYAEKAGMLSWLALELADEAGRRAAALAELADWIEEQLGDELGSRQYIAERALSVLRELGGTS